MISSINNRSVSSDYQNPKVPRSKWDRDRIELIKKVFEAKRGLEQEKPIGGLRRIKTLDEFPVDEN